MIDQLIAVLAVAVLSSLTGTSLGMPETSDIPGDTDLLQVGGAAYWALPAFAADPLGLSLYPDAMPHRIDYPGTPFGFVDLALRIGVEKADQAIKDAAADGSKVVVVGHSAGSMVVDHLQAAYLTDPDAPSSDQITFTVYGSPERGIMRLFFGDRQVIPIFAVTTQHPVESQYDTVVVTGEYDLAADPPDRPWNLLALLNSAVGFITVHHAYAFVDPDTIPAEYTTWTINSRGAKITTQLIPSEHLPLTAPLRLVRPELADWVDEVIRPVIDSAYLRHNADDPYLSGGQFVVPDNPVVNSELVTVTDHLDVQPEAAASQKRQPGRDVVESESVTIADDTVVEAEAAAPQKDQPVRDALKRVKPGVENQSVTGEDVKKPTPGEARQAS